MPSFGPSCPPLIPLRAHARVKGVNFAVAETIEPFTLDGTYTVNADCTMTQPTGTATLGTPPNTTTQTGVTFFGVIAADSNKIYQIRTDANTETIIFERVVSNQNTQ